jgi:hypothetical protein
MQNRAVHRSLYAWQDSPSLAAFWSDFLGASANTDVVLPDATFSLIQHARNRSYSFEDYLNRSYTSELDELSPQRQAALSLFMTRSLSEPDAFFLAHHFVLLDPLGKSIHPYNSRQYPPYLVKRDNVILIGGRTANPWDDLFESMMNFTAVTTFDFDGSTDRTFTAIVNRAPKAGEQSSYRGGASGYCVIAYLPNASSNGKALLIEGTNGEATEAGGEFLLSEPEMSNFRNTLHVTKFPYFEVLLKVSAVKGTPLKGTIEAYRVNPNLH